MAFLRDVVMDCSRPSAMARFWSEVLDGYRVAPYDLAEIQRLADLGINDIDDDPTVLVEPMSGDGPRFFFQRVPEGKDRKNRIHLDLRSNDVVAEVKRLCALGGRVVADHEGHVVLADIEGNEFCLLR